MSTIITSVDRHSPAEHAGIHVGEQLLTINGHPIVELHLFQFQGDLYGKRISVRPVGFLRESRRFPSPRLLAEQIQRDIQRAREILGA